MTIEKKMTTRRGQSARIISVKIDEDYTEYLIQLCANGEWVLPAGFKWMFFNLAEAVGYFEDFRDYIHS